MLNTILAQIDKDKEKIFEFIKEMISFETTRVKFSLPLKFPGTILIIKAFCQLIKRFWEGKQRASSGPASLMPAGFQNIKCLRLSAVQDVWKRPTPLMKRSK